LVVTRSWVFAFDEMTGPFLLVFFKQAKIVEIVAVKILLDSQ
jgi:hypothetical protein